MRITESQLRRIIRQEVQSLREGMPPVDREALRNMSAREYQKYWKDREKALLAVQSAAAKKAGPAPAPEPARAPRRGKAPRVTGGKATVRRAAQEALDMYYADHELHEIVDAIITMTATHELGYEPEGGGSFSDRMQIVGDEADAVVALITKFDAKAGREIGAALAEFDGY